MGMQANQYRGSAQAGSIMQMSGFQGQSNLWQAGFDGGLQDGQSPDSWGTSSAQGQPAPATLNVEDW